MRDSRTAPGDPQLLSGPWMSPLVLELVSLFIFERDLGSVYDCDVNELHVRRVRGPLVACNIERKEVWEVRRQ